MKIVRVILIIIAAIFIAMGGLFVYMMGQMKAMPTQKVTDNIYAVSHGFVNFFIITDGKNAVCIDSGSKPESTVKELAKLNLKDLNVSAIFLTHSDGDHTGGIGAFPKAKVYLPALEEQMVNGKTKRRIMGREFNIALKWPYTLFKDGEEISIGGIKVKGISTPGHTPGSMCYVVNGSYLFTGDLMVLNKGKAQVTASYISMDMAGSSNSMKKLADNLTGISILFTSHSGMTKDFAGSMEGFRK
jgi:hydroxyacylglutathione hydrolase